MRTILLATLSIAAVAGPVSAQSNAHTSGTVGTLVVAHGGSTEWNQRILDVVRAVNTGGPVEAVFLMGPGAAAHRYQDAAMRLASRGVSRIVVVPILVSSHSGHYEQIRWLAAETDSLDSMMLHHLHNAGLDRAQVSVPVRASAALDDAPELSEVLATRARKLATAPEKQALFLVAHGPNSSADVAAWMKNLRTVAERVRQQTGFQDVRVGLVQDDAPSEVRAEAVRRVREIIELQHGITRQPVVVVPVLISRGAISDQKIPRDLASLPIVYDGEPLLPHAAVARWIERVVKDVRLSSPGS